METKETYILAITSDEQFARALHSHITTNAYKLKTVAGVLQAVQAVRINRPSLLLIDRRMTGLSRIPQQDIFRNLKLLAVEPPGSSCSEDACVEEINQGFDLVVCGESYRQLVARIRAVLRRDEMDIQSQRQRVIGRVAIDLDRYEVTVGGEPIELTRTQYKILEFMMLQPMRAFTRNEILEKVWGEGIGIHDHTVDVHIHALRKKLEHNPAAPTFLQTVRGVGFRLGVPS